MPSAEARMDLAGQALRLDKAWGPSSEVRLMKVPPRILHIWKVSPYKNTLGKLPHGKFKLLVKLFAL